MYTDTTPQAVHPAALTDSHDVAIGNGSDRQVTHERALDAIIDDCFMSVGQGIGLRATLEFDAVLFLRAYLKPRFLAAMQQFGNRWQEDRHNVTAVGWMLGERAVRYANGASTIGVDEIRRATADVQRYCHLHAARRSRGSDTLKTEGATALIAGYWCTIDPPPAPTK